MKPLLVLFALAMPGCVSIPVPPFGEKVGDYGHLKLSVKVEYLPNTTNQQPTDAGLTHAQRQFNLSLRTLKDK